MDLSIKNCRKCHILDPQTGAMLSEAAVSYTRENEIYHTFPGWELVMEEAYLMPVVFFDSINGLVTCNCSICQIEPVIDKKGDYHGFCHILSVKNTADRHEDFRLPLTITVNMSYIDPETGRSGGIGGVTSNISAGGVYIIAAQKLPVQVFYTHFQHNVLPIAPQTRVLRTEPLSNGKYGYGCCFEDLSSYTESLLRRFIFHMESIHKK